MLSKRIIPCLDVRDGKLTKGIKFKGNVDIGDPVDMAEFYYREGADELVFYDITASHEARDIMLEVVRRVAERIFIPFSVGGGLRTVEDMRSVLHGWGRKGQRELLGGHQPPDHRRRVPPVRGSVRGPGHGCAQGAGEREDSQRLRDGHPRRAQAHGHRRPVVGPGGRAPGRGRDMPQQH